MEIKSYPNGILWATTYLIYDKKTKEGALIDCTCEIDNILKFAKCNNINLKYTLTFSTDNVQNVIYFESIIVSYYVIK